MHFGSAIAASAVLTVANFARAQLQSNLPPQVKITFPPPNYNLLGFQYIRLKAEASDTDGSVSFVQFYAGTNLVGVVTKPPYSVVWRVSFTGETESSFPLSAVAVDNLGEKTQSEVHRFRVFGSQPNPLMILAHPKDGETFPAPATFAFSTELLASADPPGMNIIYFYLGTNLLRRVFDTEPLSVTVTNLPEGEYTLSVRYQASYDLFCDCPKPIKIRVAKTGIQSSLLTPEGFFKLSAFTTETRNETVIEASSNLAEWTPVVTNPPTIQSFHFFDNTTNALTRFYRLLSRPP